jgi:hypothetical protein
MASFVNFTAGQDYAPGGSATLAADAISHTTGNALFVGVRWFDVGGSINISSITDTAGNTYVQVGGGKVSGASNEQLDIWYALNITGNASNIVTVNMGSSVQFWGVVVEQWSGIATSSADDGVHATDDTTGTTLTSTAFSTSQANTVVFCIAQVANTGQAWTADTGAGYTLRGNDDDQVLASQSREFTSQQTGVTVSFTSADGTSSKHMYVSAFKAVGGGGATPSQQLTLLGVG